MSAALLATLATALLITGSKEALAKRRVIAHREQRAIICPSSRNLMFS
jgi:hypothetical protein